MSRKTGIVAVLLAVVFHAVSASAQGSEVLSLNLVQDPDSAAQTQTYLTAKKPDDIVRVSWIEMRGSQPVLEPAPAAVYFARTPGGGNLANYSKVEILDTRNEPDLKPLPGNSLGVKMRNIRFRPDRNGMSAGEYNCIVAYVDNGVTYYSNYFKVMVTADKAATLIAPKELLGAKRIDELTPTFSWNRVEGVPYYHILLSDEPFPVEEMMESGSLSGLDLSIVWQAITPNTRITYGTPDPSRTITAAPPPLSPEKEYMWMVFNNYGNHMAFTDGNVFDLPGMFVINGMPLNEPRVLSPKGRRIINGRDTTFIDTTINGVDGDITFRWSNLDQRASTYLINLSVTATPSSLGMADLDSIDDVKASLLVWEEKVLMPKNYKDTVLSATLRDPLGTLTGKEYVWSVYALDERGAGTTGNASKGEFLFKGMPVGNLDIRTMEVIGGTPAGVGYAELKSEVISGPMQAPVGFYTDNDGRSKREFSPGTYRITAVKDGYNNESIVVTVPEGGTAAYEIYMRRPDAVVFGRVADSVDQSWINTAKVTGVSEWGDTVTALTNANGNFTLNCREADWTITVDRAGYRTPRPRVIPLRQGENHNVGTVYLPRHTERLSGVVRNSLGQSVLGARVRVLRDGVLVNELASTPENGAYSFLLPPGTYTLTVEMPGFSMFNRTIDFTGSANLDAVIVSNAAMVSGSIMGRSWNTNKGDYEVAPIPGARITFTDDTDTLTVTSDVVFGNFSLSVSGGRTFAVRAEAGGFMGGEVLKPVTTTAGETKFYTDTLSALARISGRTWLADDDGNESPVGNVDVIVYDPVGRRAVASAKSSHTGNFEIRNIPDGSFIINAGMIGHYQYGSVRSLVVTDGKPDAGNFKIVVAKGKKTITWNVNGYNGAGVVKVVSPLNRIMPFSSGSHAKLDDAGPAVYTIEAVAEDDATLLQLSNRKFTVNDDESAEHTESISFPLKHAPQGTVSLAEAGRVASLTVSAVSADVPITGIALVYRSEGSSRWDSVYTSDIKSITSTASATVRTKPNTVRDGADLQYYFRVFLSDGDGYADIYGSEKQIFTVYVAPSEQYITRLSVNPGVANPDRDTLVLPSSYKADFVLNAFYSDLFLPVDTTKNIGGIKWEVVSGSGGTVSSGGRHAALTTGAGSGRFLLRATLTPTGAYSVRQGQNTVSIPIRVTGAPLDAIMVLRNGESGPITNTERASFRVEARDAANSPVTVSAKWLISPEASGDMRNGVYTPTAGYFGNVHVYASVADGRHLEEYREPGVAQAGLRVVHMIRSRGTADTADTRKGLRMAIPANALPSGQSAELRAVVRPEPENSVHRGGGGFRMADSLSYDIEFADMSRLNADAEIGISIDIPAHLKDEASKSPESFKIARWYSDSLAWIELPSSKVAGGAVTAWLNRTADDLAINAAMRSAASSDPQTLAKSKTKIRAKKIRADKKSLAKSAAAAAVTASSAPSSQMHESARYALVMKTNKLSVDVTVSPNPFSPYIRPVKEYGRFLAREEIPYGTCIRVSVEAPESFVRSMKVHIYNATGQRVWAVEKLNALVGENRIWWDGRTTNREEVWSEDFLERNKNRGRMARNGRYFVTVIVTDIEGRQRRVMKPIVLMK